MLQKNLMSFLMFSLFSVFMIGCSEKENISQIENEKVKPELSGTCSCPTWYIECNQMDLNCDPVTIGWGNNGCNPDGSTDIPKSTLCTGGLVPLTPPCLDGGHECDPACPDRIIIEGISYEKEPTGYTHEYPNIPFYNSSGQDCCNGNGYKITYEVNPYPGYSHVFRIECL